MLYPLEKRGRWSIINFTGSLLRCVDEFSPDMVHGYLGTSNLLSVVVKWLRRGVKSVWGLRASDVDYGRYSRLARLDFGLQRLLSRFADLIIVNSQAGFDYAREKGFPGKRMEVVSNGVDTELFRPDRESGRPLRAEWGVGDHEVLVGLVARLDPMKDHEIFFKAASTLVRENSRIRFVCVGSGPDDYFEELKGQAVGLGLKERLFWAGGRSGMPAVYNALDVLCLCSAFGEGFSNVLAEAMACGVPCVSTDVGDARLILGDTGLVVDRGSPEELAEALLELVRRIQDGKRFDTRLRIVDDFSLDKMVERAEELLESM